MSELSKCDVRVLAKSAGLDLDEPRARTIASRLSGVIDELDQISDDKLNDVEPAHRFTVDPS